MRKNWKSLGFKWGKRWKNIIKSLGRLGFSILRVSEQTSPTLPNRKALEMPKQKCPIRVKVKVRHSLKKKGMLVKGPTKGGQKAPPLR